jgi:multidrug efflux pump subunit AcrA (membrane-fusion protein)
VKTGPIIDGLRVVSGGLKPDEQVIVEGLMQPGVVVDPRPMEAP